LTEGSNVDSSGLVETQRSAKEGVVGRCTKGYGMLLPDLRNAQVQNRNEEIFSKNC